MVITTATNPATRGDRIQDMIIQQVIKVSDTEEFSKVIAGLVQQGLTFSAEFSAGEWVITLTGGY